VRTLGVDVGTARVGLAVSDPDGLVATPLTTLTIDAPRDRATGLPLDPRAWGRAVAVRVASAAAEHACDAVVVGLPRALSGRETASSDLARRVVRELEEQGAAVEVWDERLSSVEADRVLRAASGGRGGRRRSRDGQRDQTAAAIILQGWLDAHRS